MHPIRLSLSAVLAAGGLLISSLAAGQVLTHDYQVLIDVDRDTSTGCSVTPTSGAVLDGFEHRLLATVEVSGATATVVSLDRQDCGGTSFGASQALTVPASAPYGAALDAGLSGSDSLELAVPRSEISAMFSTGVRLVFLADSGSGSDVLATTDGSASGSAIVLGMPFDPEPIPLFTWWGIALLLGAIMLLGWLAQRRSGRLAAVGMIVLVAGVAWAMSFMLDGDLSDWSGLSPNGQDVLGDATDGSAANDLLAGFAAFENETLYFRIDVVDMQNSAPSASADSYGTDEDTPLNVAAPGVLGNDTDAESDPLTAVLDSGPANASSFTLNADGSFVYTPAADFNGSDSFTYHASDGQADSAAVTVTLTVNAVNDAPTVQGDTATTNEDVQVDIDVLANDSDIDGNLDPATVSVTSPPANGTTVVDAGTGVITYTKAVDFNGSDSFVYEVCDDGTPTPVDCASATVSITVNPVNDAPTAVDDAFTVEEDSSGNALAVLANDTIAPDSGETLTVTAVGVPDQGGTATTGGSSISYTPTADFVGTETFTYTIGDGNGGSDTATVTVTVNNTNQDAPACVADSGTTDEDSATLIGVLANDSDPDPGQTATLTVSAVDTTGTTGSVTNNGTDVTYDPNGQFESLGAGDQATDTFGYTAQDTDGLTCMAMVTVTITGIDDPAVTANDTYRAVGNTPLEVDDVQDDPQPSVFVSASVLDNDSDPDNTLSVSGTSNVTAGAVVNMAADGTFTYVPPAGLRGDGNPATADDSFDYQLSGGETATVSIDIDGLVWYVDNTANGSTVNTGSGTSVDRFSTLGDAGANADPDDAEDSSIAGDIVYVFQGDGGTTNQNAGYLMNDGEHLLGEAVDLIVDLDGTPTTLFTGNAANRPRIGNASGDGVTVAADALDHTSIEIRGLSIQGGGNAVEFRASNTFSADAIIADNAFLDSGQSILDLNPDSSGPFYVTIANNDFSAGAANSGHAVDLTSTGAANEINLAFDNNTGIASLGGAAVMLDNSSGGGDLYITGFSGNSVRGFSVARGVVVQNAVFDADPSDSNFSGDTVVVGSLSIGSSVDPIGSNALDLINVRGDLDLGTLGLFANGSGVRVGSSGPLNAGAGTGFGVSSTGGTIDAKGGPALNIDGATASLLTSTLNSSGSGTTGVSLVDVAGSLFASSGSITGSAGNAFQIASTLGSPLDLTYGGTVTNSSGRLINLDGLPSGSDLLFNGSSLDDNGGAGIAVNDFDGVFTLSAGTTAISNSTTTGFSATGDTDGTANLDNVTITNSASTAISIVDGADRIGGSFDFDNVDVSHATNGARAVDIQGLSSGMVDFDASSAITATDGTGINISSNAGTSPVRFFGTVDLGTSGARLSDGTALGFSANSGGTTLIAADIDVFTAGQTAVNASGSGTLDLDALSIDTASNGRALDLDGIRSLVVIDAVTCSHNTNCVDLTNLAATSLTTFGGVGLTCSGGTCFNAIAARTVEVTGSGNTISATNATAIDLTNTTIGASGVTFESLSASGATNGIVLDSTGSVAGAAFVVTGDGGSTQNGSGGSLVSMGGDAIRLTDTGNISLDQLDMSNVLGNGIAGVRVNGLTVSNAAFTTIGDVDGEDVFNFNRDTQGDNGLVGTALFQNLSITTFAERAIDIVNEGGGSLDLDILDVSASDNNDTFGEDAVRVQTEGTVNADVLVSGGTYDNIELDMLAYFAQGTGTNTVEVTGVTSTNGGGPDNNPNGGGVAIIGSAGSTTSFDIDSNSLTGVQGAVIQIIGLAGPGQTLTLGGTIGGPALADGNTLSSDNADGMDLDFDGDPGGGSTIGGDIVVQNNIIEFDDDGIGVDHRDAAGTMNITIRGNTLNGIAGDDAVTTDLDDGIFVFTDDDVGAAVNQINLEMIDNVINNIDGAKNVIEIVDVQNGNKVCFSATGTSISSGGGEIELDTDSASDLVVDATSSADLSSLNNGIAVQEIVVPTYDNTVDCIP